MDQETRWLTRYNEVKTFIETNKRNPSKYAPEEKLLVHFLKRGRILMKLFVEKTRAGLRNIRQRSAMPAIG